MSSPSSGNPDERLDVQKKTFGKWINSQLSNVQSKGSEGQVKVTDLFYDLRDGKILLTLLEILTKKKIKREKGSLRVHKLSNVAIVLNVLRENQVKLVNINNVEIVDGNPKITLALVWSIILHWQFNKILGSEIQHVSNLEKSLLAWCRQSSENYKNHVSISDFTHSWKNGLAFCAILHHYRPHLFKFEMVVPKEPVRRLEFAFNILQKQVGIPRLLDPEDLQRPDKKSVMTYVMCMFQKLPHEDVNMETLNDVSINSDPDFRPENIVDSPLKSPIKNLKQSKPLDYKTFCSIHEDVLEWLLDIEDKLKSMKPLGTDLSVVREQFDEIEAFLKEVISQENPETEVKNEGLRLIEAGLSPKEEKDVRVRLKLLCERWKAFRESAHERQNMIGNAVMELQCKELDRIREWMTATEDKISKFNGIGGNKEKVVKALAEHQELQKEFQAREAQISNFICVVSSSATEKEFTSKHDLEGHLEAIEERWVVLYEWIENRGKKLSEVVRLWNKFDEDKSHLESWLNTVEQLLRKMQQFPTEEASELRIQAQQIQEIQSDIEQRQKQLLALESVADKLLAVMENESEASPEVSKRLEAVTDRWEILSEVMDAQRLRLSNLGFSISDSAAVSSSSVSQDNKNTAIKRSAEDKNPLEEKSTVESKHEIDSMKPENEDDTHLDDDDGSLKKRKITGTKRIEFETNFAKATTWLRKTADLLKEHTEQDTFPNQAASTGKEQHILTEYNRILQEVSVNLETLCREAIVSGEDLIQEIQNEADFPPDYLGNVEEKLSALKSEVENIEHSQKKLEQRIEYLEKKKQFYQKVQERERELRLLEEWLQNESVSKLEDSIRIDDSISFEDVCKSHKECAEHLKFLENFEDVIPSLKREANQITLKPGALQDPSSQLKSDIYELCEKWESLQNRFTQRECLLSRMKKQAVERDSENSQGDMPVVSSKLSESPDEASKANNEKGILQKLHAPVSLEATEAMEEEIKALKERLDVGYFRDEIRTQIEARVQRLDEELTQLKQFLGELNGLELWMNEVESFLNANMGELEDTETLEAQLMESDALLDDITTLKPNVNVLNEVGLRLKSRASKEFADTYLAPRLKTINENWEKTVEKSKEQNKQLRSTLETSKNLSGKIPQLLKFLKQIEKTQQSTSAPVSQSSEISQRTTKLSDLLSSMEKKRHSLNEAKELYTQNESNEVSPELASIEKRWGMINQKLLDAFQDMKMASLEYGEFITTYAQVSDWLERMEKKLGKSAITAVDAEEISEEHDDIENMLKNDPEDRLNRLDELCSCLKGRNVIISNFESDSKKLRSKWTELALKAKKRLSLLEGSIEEAQEWEYKLNDVQNWLSEKDRILTFYLEQELMVDDLPDESQTMLREFEDQENLLSDMDSQVDAYRESGKVEAAARLEDQLLLIHQKFQELLMKFELFQQPPTAHEYEPRLDRVHRQLRDIRDKIDLTDLKSVDSDEIQSKAHHAKCIYNALSDIKPEVENVIKMGRKVADAKDEKLQQSELTVKIDSLKEEFNDIGSKISERKRLLEKASNLSENFKKNFDTIQCWLSSLDSSIGSLKCTKEEEKKFLLRKADEMKKMKEQVKTLRSTKEDFKDLDNPAILTNVESDISAMEVKWAKVLSKFEKRLSQLTKDKPKWAKQEAIEVDFESLKLSPFREAHPIQTDLSPIVTKYQSDLREMKAWLEDINGRTTTIPVDARSLGQKQKKLEQLQSNADKLIGTFPGRKDEIEADMALIMEKFNALSEKFKKQASDDVLGASSASETQASEKQEPFTDDESISTLPEESYSRVSSNRQISSEKNSSKVLQTNGGTKQTIANSQSSPTSSRSSSSPEDLEVVKGTMILQSNSPAFMRETISKIPRPKHELKEEKNEEFKNKESSPVKTPPKTLPKPQWFKLSREEEKSEKQEIVTGEKEEQEQTLEGSHDDEDLDAYCAKENSAIDRILHEAKSDLTEKRKQASPYKVNKNAQEHFEKDVIQFQESVHMMLEKIKRAKKQVSDLRLEHDLSLRQDLIGMESRVIEAEVTTLISRGDTLILLAQRNNSSRTDILKRKVNELRDAWQDVKQTAERMIRATEKSSEEITQFKSTLADLKKWLEETNRKIQKQPKRTDLAAIAVDILAKKEVIDELSKQALSWPKSELSGNQGITLAMITTQWENLQQKVLKYGKEKGIDIPAAKPNDTNRNATNEGAQIKASEILGRIEKMREAVAAIERQMKTQILAGKPYENLSEQEQALKTVKDALEKLRPTIKRTAKDLDNLTYSLSVEYLEKVVLLSERLRDDWQRVNKSYIARQDTWTQCNGTFSSYQKKRRELENWLERAERLLISKQNKSSGLIQEKLQLEKQVSEKNKEVTEFALTGKEIMSQTSAQEHLEIQSQVDKILKRWKFLLTQLASQKDTLNQEKFNNNVNYMNKWLNDNLGKMNSTVNPSDYSALKEAQKVVTTCQESLIEKENQLEKLCNSEAAFSEDTLNQLRSKYDHLVDVIPRRLLDVEKKLESLNILSSKIATASIWVNHIDVQVRDVKRKSPLSNHGLRRTEQLYKEKQGDIDEVIRLYNNLSNEAAANNFEIDKSICDQVNTLMKQWESLGNQISEGDSLSNDGEEISKKKKRRSSSFERKAPEIFANLRDHRDFVRRKSGQLASQTLGGSVASVQKQLEEQQIFRRELENHRNSIENDLQQGKKLTEQKDIKECAENLEKEWADLNERSQAWQNKIENALANLRIFEKGLTTFEARLDDYEKCNATLKQKSKKRMVSSSDQDLLQKLLSEISTLEQMMAELREQASRISSLSPTTLIHVQKTDEKLIELKAELEELQRAELGQTQSRQENNMSNNERFNEALPMGWERGVTEEDIPYYLNHKTESTQWDHPLFSELMESLLEMNTVKYSAYRLALKLRKIQQRLCLDLLDLEVAVSGFNEHGLTPQRHDMSIQIPEMITVLTSIYETLHEEEPEEVDVPLCVDLCLNWLLNVYDAARVGHIRVLSFKLGVLTLCKGPLTEKYLHLYKLVTRERMMSPRQLGLLLFDAIQVPKVLGEVAAFGGSNIEPSVRSCFKMGIIKEGAEPHKDIDATHFLKWLRQEPQCLVWLPVLHRLASAEAAKHNAKCKVCKMSPIVGFRYHCLKCFNFDLCNNCFFVGKTAKGHKPEHPMQEYCTSTGTTVNLKNFGQSMRNSFRSKKYFQKKQQKLGYLPVNSVLEGENYSSPPSLSPNLSAESRDLHGSQSSSLQPKVLHESVLTNDSTDLNRFDSSKLSNSIQQEDEHAIIARYCRVLSENDDDATDAEDLQKVIQDLEEKNRLLTQEYEQLREQKSQNVSASQVEDDADEELAKEAKKLKQHSSRLETRMNILENHNQKLSQQLVRLRHLLAEESIELKLKDDPSSSNPTNFGTLQSKSVVATKLQSGQPEENGHAVVGRRRPPNSSQFLSVPSGISKMRLHAYDNQRASVNDEDSLNLSDYETQTVSDE